MRSILLGWIAVTLCLLAFSTNIAPVSAATRTPGQALIVVAPCNFSYYVKIWYNNGNSVECFSNDGYTGLGSVGAGNLPNISEIDAGNNCGWIRVYNNNGVGVFLPFNSWTAGYAQGPGDNSFFGGFTGLITQVDIQGQNCHGSHS